MAIDGTYNIEVDSPMGKQEFKLTMKTAGDKLNGTMESPMGNNDFTGTVKGNEVSWPMEIASPMGNMKLELNGKVTDDDITGVVKVGSFGSAPFKGKKA